MKVRLSGMAVPWDTLSSDKRPPKEPAACGLPYYRMYRPGAFDGSLQRMELGAELPAPLVWTHEAVCTLASTGDGSLRLWNGTTGLMFSAEVNVAEPAIAEVIHRLRPRRYGVSLETASRVQRFEFTAGKWTKVIFSAELVHIAIESNPAFPTTWVRVEPAAVVLPFRSRDPRARSFGGVRISA